MKFESIGYTRPNAINICEEISLLSNELVESRSQNRNIEFIFNKFNTILIDLESAKTISHIRHKINTNDPFYQSEIKYLDYWSPVIDEKINSFYHILSGLSSKSALISEYGKILFDKMNLIISCSNNNTIRLQQRENELVTRYQQICSNAIIVLNNRNYSLSQMSFFNQHINRQIRKQAQNAKGVFFDKNQELFDNIFDELVKNRTEQAHLLGHASFTELGDIRMLRMGYTRNDIKKVRYNIIKYVVPELVKIKKLQQERIGVEKLKIYDDKFLFQSGNPVPMCAPTDLIEIGCSMFSKMSLDTKEFINYMMENELYDLQARQGKSPGGSCSYIASYKSPFVFSNFNGTEHDVRVFTHEFGHAFAFYISGKNDVIPQLFSPGSESCEIHSMGMEFLTSNYYELFFGDQAKMYRLLRVEEAFSFLSYGCQVDEFQEIIYNEPGLSPLERNNLWIELEHKYRPWSDFDSINFYSRGAGWQQQTHIYGSPFYYIDYVLAQTVALDFFLLAIKNKKEAWNRYLKLVQLSGKKIIRIC